MVRLGKKATHKRSRIEGSLPGPLKLQGPVPELNSASCTSGFDPSTQVKTCFDCKMFDVANWVPCLNGENGPGGTPLHEALSVSPQEALEITSVTGQPPSLDRSHCSTPRLVAKSLKLDERCRPLQTPQMKVGALT